jgi:predicted nuclease with TOPRIM domain
LEREVSIAHDTIADLKDEITGLRTTTTKHASLATELEALQASYTALDARHKEQRNKTTSLQVDNAELKAQLERVGQSSQQFDDIKRGLEEANEQLKHELSTLKVGTFGSAYHALTP